MLFSLTPKSTASALINQISPIIIYFLYAIMLQRHAEALKTRSSSLDCKYAFRACIHLCPSPPLLIQCHYSMKKAASFLGIGTQNVYFVETDGR